VYFRPGFETISIRATPTTVALVFPILTIRPSVAYHPKLYTETTRTLRIPVRTSKLSCRESVNWEQN